MSNSFPRKLKTNSLHALDCFEIRIHNVKYDDTTINRTVHTYLGLLLPSFKPPHAITLLIQLLVTKPTVLQSRTITFLPFTPHKIDSYYSFKQSSTISCVYSELPCPPLSFVIKKKLVKSHEREKKVETANTK